MSRGTGGTWGDGAAPDREICRWAQVAGYIVLPNDLDFPQILAHTGDSGPSVVLLRGEPLVPDVREAELLQGAIVSLDWSGPPRARVPPLR